MNIGTFQIQSNSTLSASRLNELFGVVKLTHQDIATGISVGDLVFFDSSTNEWEKSFLSTPGGIYIGDNKVVTEGYTNQLSGLTPGKYYFMDDNGDLTTDFGGVYNNIKVGYSMSDTEMLVNIKHIGDSFASERGFGDVVFSTVVGDRDFGFMREGIDYEVSGNTLRLKPNIIYEFNSFDLRTGTTLTVMSEVDRATVLYISCTTTCNIDGHVDLTDINDYGMVHEESYNISIGGTTFTYPGVGNGGIGGYGSSSLRHLGFGSGGHGGGTNIAGNIVNGGTGARGRSFFGSRGNRGSVSSGSGRTGYWEQEGGDAVEGSAGGGGAANLLLEENTNATASATGGYGGNSYGANGSNGSIGVSGSGQWTVFGSASGAGGGGAGGRAGKSGIHFVIKADVITFGGSLNASGTDGQGGGDGGRRRTQGPDWSGHWFSWGGCGGGGGGGGSSGNFYVFYGSSQTVLDNNIILNGGVGGDGGRRPDDGSGNTSGSPVGYKTSGAGSVGINGNDGGIIINSYN